MTFEEANKFYITAPNKKFEEMAIKAFGCTYFHTICIRCANKASCYRKEPYVKKCNFFKENT